jgi:NAD(P)-dependent dehydrogenase (short-subunit alcohol dehydrogenase family)
MTVEKAAIVSGAGSGIGRATALLLGAKGYHVGVLGRTRSELDETRDLIVAAGGKARVVAADVSDSAEMRDAVCDFVASTGRLDAVVANAGINGVWAPIDDLQPEEWEKTINVNLTGTYLTIHNCVPHLKAAGGGSIVVVSSINGTRTFTTPGATAYTATKAAQVAMVKQLALELARHHIRINAVCPGEIETSIEANTDLRHEEQTAIPVVWPEGQVPISGGKPGSAKDVASVICFLLSDEAGHMTGSPVWVDGGQGLLR